MGHIDSPGGAEWIGWVIRDKTHTQEELLDAYHRAETEVSLLNADQLAGLFNINPEDYRW